MDNYIPKIHDSGEYIEMVVAGKKCPSCKKIMIDRLPAFSIFPMFWNMSQEAQAQRAGIIFVSSAKVDDNYICEECKQAGKASFLCVLCGERKSSDKMEDSIGDPPEYLCKDCYDTVPAKIWDEKVHELREEHRYDFE